MPALSASAVAWTRVVDHAATSGTFLAARFRTFLFQNITTPVKNITAGTSPITAHAALK
jgi:hypothetical protein